MQEIANGEGDLRQRLPEEGTDELSELGRRFNAFVIKIQATIREVGATTDQVASAAEELSRVANETRASVQEQGSKPIRLPPRSMKWQRPSSKFLVTPMRLKVLHPMLIAWRERVVKPLPVLRAR